MKTRFSLTDEEEDVLSDILNLIIDNNILLSYNEEKVIWDKYDDKYIEIISKKFLDSENDDIDYKFRSSVYYLEYLPNLHQSKIDSLEIEYQKKSNKLDKAFLNIDKIPFKNLDILIDELSSIIDKIHFLIRDSRKNKINTLIKNQENIIKHAIKSIEYANQEINIIKERYKNDK